MKGQTDH